MALKKPTRKKYPKAPKSNASAEVWQRYRDKIAMINSEHEANMAKYMRDLKAREKAKSDVKDLKSGKKPRSK